MAGYGPLVLCVLALLSYSQKPAGRTTLSELTQLFLLGSAKMDGRVVDSRKRVCIVCDSFFSWFSPSEYRTLQLENLFLPFYSLSKVRILLSGAPQENKVEGRFLNL